MRPIKLEFEGFTSFREQNSIDFSNLGLFAITGPTGAGKTSIIDAFTYVLYGCTPRIGEKQVRELISQGKQRVSVLLEFTSNGKQYRISRVGKWTGKSMSTELRFEEWNGEEWTMLSDSVSKAKPLIESVIGLDFDGFTKSVILPQGAFDKFLKGRPDERRKILSDLLNLDVYSRMMRSANEIAKRNQEQASFIEQQLKTDFADATPGNVELLKQQITALEPQIHDLSARLDLLKSALPHAHQIRQDQEELAKAEKERKELIPKEETAANKLQQIRANIEDMNAGIAGLDRRIQSNTYDSQLHLRLTSDLARMQEFVKLEAEAVYAEQKFNERKVVLLNLQEQENVLRGDAERANADLVKAIRAQEKSSEDLNRLRKLYGSPDAIKSEIENVKQIRLQQKKTSKGEQDVSDLQRKQKRLQAELQTLREQEKQAGKRVAVAQDKLTRLQRSHLADALRADLHPGEACPVCEQEVLSLPKRRKHAPLEQAQRECNESAAALADLQERITNTKIELGPLATQIESKQAEIAELTESVRALILRYEGFSGETLTDDAETRLANRKKEFEEAMRRNEKTSETLQQKQKVESEASQSLKEKSHDKALAKQELSGLNTQMAEQRKKLSAMREQLGAVDLATLQAQLKEQETAGAEREQLDLQRAQKSAELSAAKDALAPAQSSYDLLVANRKTTEATIAQLKQRIAENTEKLIQCGAGGAPADLETAIQTIDSQRATLQNQCIRLESQITALTQKVERAAELRHQLDTHREKFNEAKELGLALQGDEFIAFIQQEAYRRLAQDGSVHLKLLSSERYSFTVENEDFHVIDHWNADDTRPVSTLSGGESFLASLALALALAEGLSGMSSGQTKFALESLFLDEGFGTLDPETLEIVVSGIEALSLNDRLIGIISHIPDLADRMLARITVRKSPTGSTLEMQ